MDNKPFYSDRDLAARWGVSRISVWRWAEHGKLAQPVKLGPNTARWTHEAVAQFEARAAGQAERAA